MKRTFFLALASIFLVAGCNLEFNEEIPTNNSTSADLNSQSPDQPVDNDLGAKVGFKIGDLAPEIKGVDIDGVVFSLSDYRGKVVVIDFWGDW